MTPIGPFRVEYGALLDREPGIHLVQRRTPRGHPGEHGGRQGDADQQGGGGGSQAVAGDITSSRGSAASQASEAAGGAGNGVLLMPPALYRSGIGEDGTFRFYATVIDRVARRDLRLYLYHFPDICGVPITARLVRRPTG